jgi:hypothetical protein
MSQEELTAEERATQIVAEWIHARETSMDGASFGAAVELVMFAFNRRAQAVARAPDAYVPIHPRSGPLWANTVPTLESDHPTHYEMRPVYFAAAPAAPAVAPARDELASMTRMFHAACADLGAINEALGLDPNDGGAAPIIAAIQALQGRPLPEDVEIVVSCLGDDAAKLREANPDDEMADNMDEAVRLLNGLGAAPEGCTPADAQMLRAANHQLAAENDYLRREDVPSHEPADSETLDLPDWVINAKPPAPETMPAPPEQEEERTRSPFANCQFRECDLPGQCRGEGKCHHPKADQQGDGGARCTCGDTSALNTVHRAHGPCYLAEQPSARVAYANGYYDGCLHGPTATRKDDAVQVSSGCVNGGDSAGNHSARDVRLTGARVALSDEAKQRVYDAVRDALGDAYDCTRVWHAWGRWHNEPRRF